VLRPANVQRRSNSSSSGGSLLPPQHPPDVLKIQALPVVAPARALQRPYGPLPRRLKFVNPRGLRAHGGYGPHLNDPSRANRSALSSGHKRRIPACWLHGCPLGRGKMPLTNSPKEPSPPKAFVPFPDSGPRRNYTRFLGFSPHCVCENSNDPPVTCFQSLAPRPAIIVRAPRV